MNNLNNTLKAMGVEGLTKEEAQLLLTGKLGVTKDSTGGWAEAKDPAATEKKVRPARRAGFTIGRRDTGLDNETTLNNSDIVNVPKDEIPVIVQEQQPLSWEEMQMKSSFHPPLIQLIDEYRGRIQNDDIKEEHGTSNYISSLWNRLRFKKQ